VNVPAADWRNRLRGDPAPWLLNYADNPSVYFWFQRDIVGRPEDAAAMIRAREMILYSTPVQQILAAQGAGGFWDNPYSLMTPRYSATLWQLALLTELGIPRESRRARAACEFIVANHLATDGTFAAPVDQAPAGLLLRSLAYFNCDDDPRVNCALEALAVSVPTSAPGAVMYAVSALVESQTRHRSPAVAEAIVQGEEILLDAFARNEFATFGAFPPFDETDALFALRVLASQGRASDPRANHMIEKIWARQDKAGRWQFEKILNEHVALELEQIGMPSKWATLNALRVVTKL